MRNPLKVRLAEGKAITLAMITMPSTAAIQIWARSGVDGLCIDLEHGPIDIATAHAMIAATTGGHGVPLVRVPWNVPWLVKPVLDAGAMGVLFPMIADAADAEAAVRSVRYPPEGERGWGPFYASFRWNLSIPRYVEVANEELFTTLLIERPEAIRNLDEIVQVPGIDMLVIAPFDLRVTMGYPNQPEHPAVVDAIRTAEQKILRSGVPLCGAALTPGSANEMLERGYRGVFLGFDWMILHRAAAGLLEGLRLEGGSPAER